MDSNKISPDLSETEAVLPDSAASEHYINFSLAPGEYLVQCPYNNSHRILSERMSNHLARCRTNHKNRLNSQGLAERYINCRWNEFHIIPESEGFYHASKCPGRDKCIKHELEDIKKYAPKNKISSPPELSPLIEDWGAEPPRHLAYDPMKKVREEPIFYQPKGLSRAAKIKFREEQRLKFYRLVSGPFWESYQSCYSKIESTKEQSLPAPTGVSGKPGTQPNNQDPSRFLDQPFSRPRLDFSQHGDFWRRIEKI